MGEVAFMLEKKAVAFIKSKGAEAVTIHSSSMSCSCCSSGTPPTATLGLPEKNLDAYDKYLVDGVVIYFPRTAYEKLSSRKTIHITLEGFWFFKALAVKGFSAIK